MRGFFKLQFYVAILDLEIQNANEVHRKQIYAQASTTHSLVLTIMYIVVPAALLQGPLTCPCSSWLQLAAFHPTMLSVPEEMS